MRQPITDRRQLEAPWPSIPTRAFLPAAAQDAAVAVRCTRLAGSDALDDPHDVGGGAVVELVYANDSLAPFEQFLAFHKSHGFEFGYGGSGPSALAANILGLLLPPTEAWRLHQDFKAAFVARVPRDGGEIPMAAVRAWVEARWAEERSDDVLMNDEEERLALAAKLGAGDDALDEELDVPADADARVDERTVTVSCSICRGRASAELPEAVEGADFRALVALVHTRATCDAWRTAVLRWPDGRVMGVELPE